MAAQINRSRLLGVGGSVAAHLAFFVIVVWSLRTPGPPPEPPALRVGLVPLSALTAPPPPARTGRARDRTPAPDPVAVTPQPIAGAGPPVPAGAPQSNPGPDQHPDIAAVRAALRAAVGCANQHLLQLTPDERARCADRFARRTDQDSPWGPPIPADKLARYDAEIQARKAARRPDMLGCVLAFDASRVKPVSGPGYGEKLGPLPCYTGDGRALKSEDIRKGQPRPDLPP